MESSPEQHFDIYTPRSSVLYQTRKFSVSYYYLAYFLSSETSGVKGVPDLRDVMIQYHKYAEGMKNIT